MLSGSGWRIDGMISRLQNKFDYLIIDSPPHNDSDSKAVMRIANLLLVPMQASPADLWATENTMMFAQNEGIKSRIILNRVNIATKIVQDIKDKMSPELQSIILDSYLGNRIAFSHCFLNGMTVTETAPNQIASIEVKKMTEELLSLIQLEIANKEQLNS
jgi:chromosome partitioning protein